MGRDTWHVETVLAAVGMISALLLSGCGTTRAPLQQAATACVSGNAGFVGGITVPTEPSSGVATLTGNCWADISPTPVSNVIPGVGTAQIPGGKTPTLQTAWTAKDLYLKCNVYAWPLYAASASAPATDDACEFMVSGDNNHNGTFGTYAAHITVAYNSTTPALGTHGSGLTSLTGFTVQNTTEQGKGYMVELTIPWAALGINPAKGQQYAFDAAVDYNDAQGNYVAYADITGTQNHPCCSTKSWTGITLG